MDDDTNPIPAKKARLTLVDYVKVIFGEDKQEFMVHKKPLCSRSEFFKAACSERWSEPNEIATVELLEDVPEIFDILLCCIYKDRVDIGDIGDPLIGENPGKAFFSFETEHRLVRAYILADKLRDVVSANLFMDSLIDYYIYIMGLQPYCEHDIANLVANNSTTRSH